MPPKTPKNPDEEEIIEITTPACQKLLAERAPTSDDSFSAWHVRQRQEREGKISTLRNEIYDLKTEIAKIKAGSENASSKNLLEALNQLRCAKEKFLKDEVQTQAACDLIAGKHVLKEAVSAEEREALRAESMFYGPGHYEVVFHAEQGGMQTSISGQASTKEELENLAGGLSQAVSERQAEEQHKKEIMALRFEILELECKLLKLEADARFEKETGKTKMDAAKKLAECSVALSLQKLELEKKNEIAKKMAEFRLQAAQEAAARREAQKKQDEQDKQEAANRKAEQQKQQLELLENSRKIELEKVEKQKIQEEELRIAEAKRQESMARIAKVKQTLENYIDKQKNSLKYKLSSLSTWWFGISWIMKKCSIRYELVNSIEMFKNGFAADSKIALNDDNDVITLLRGIDNRPGVLHGFENKKPGELEKIVRNTLYIELRPVV